MTEVENQIAALRLFNEKVKELLESSFVKAVTKPSAGFSLSGERQDNGSFKMSSTVRGPSVESIKAFVLPFVSSFKIMRQFRFVKLLLYMIQAILTLSRKHISSQPGLKLIICWMPPIFLT